MNVEESLRLVKALTSQVSDEERRQATQSENWEAVSKAMGAVVSPMVDRDPLIMLAVPSLALIVQTVYALGFQRGRKEGQQQARVTSIETIDEEAAYRRN
jgi:hypothetical protein